MTVLKLHQSHICFSTAKMERILCLSQTYTVIVIFMCCLWSSFYIRRSRFHPRIQYSVNTSANCEHDIGHSKQWFSAVREEICDTNWKSRDGSVITYPDLYLLHKPSFDTALSLAFKQTNTRLHSGHTGQKEKQTMIFLTLINRTKCIKNVCETGFNAGHSALTWLTGNHHVHVYTFDLGHYPYSKLMASYLKTTFTGRFSVIWGDTKKTIPRFTTNNPHLKCDLIFIDGGHSYTDVKADLRNLRIHANKDQHILLLDDVLILGTDNGVNKAWSEYIRAGLSEEYFKCKSTNESKNHNGFALGKYVSLQ